MSLERFKRKSLLDKNEEKGVKAPAVKPASKVEKQIKKKK